MTQQHDAARPLTRRTLAKGAAWSVPVIAVASAAPALAASPYCDPDIKWGGGIYYDYGSIVADWQAGSSTNQTLSLGGRTRVLGLPQGVRVTDIKYTFWIENRQGQSSSGPGIFWIGNPTSNLYGTCTSSKCSVLWDPQHTPPLDPKKFPTTQPSQVSQGPTPNSGFSTTVTNTVNNIDKTYPDGSVVKSFDVNMTWSAARDSVATYNTEATGCQTFDSGSSSRFPVYYTGVVAMTDSTVARGSKRIRTFADITVTLSNGQTLNKTYPVDYFG